jgi:hypothetical protein
LEIPEGSPKNSPAAPEDVPKDFDSASLASDTPLSAGRTGVQDLNGEAAGIRHRAWRSPPGVEVKKSHTSIVCVHHGDTQGTERELL